MSTQRKKTGSSPAEPPAPEAASKAKKKSTPKTVEAAETAAAEPATAPAKKSTAKSAAKEAAKTGPARKSAAKKSTASAKPATVKKTASRAGKSTARTESEETASAAALTGPVEDPIGDLSDGEAARPLAGEAQPEAPAMMEAYRADTTGEAENGLPELEPAARQEKPRKRAKVKAAEPEPVEGENEPEQAAAKDELEILEDRAEEADESHEPRPEPHLERLQKILSQAGIASRRHAEEMITAGRVMVNGQAVTQLGAKADPTRDHIRVDGKLIQVEVRHRTFVLNKPKGYVTTVSDPEGRPTVMQFFEKVRERLYPVGRLDYQSEGLLLMTNDGELANQLTRAASGVEKTYLVKVAGQPDADAIDKLRGGVSIDREQPGSGRVRTAPAQVRQIRSGDNPWFEVVLTEGRNRELRKMFNAVGHFVEKIRRVGYGPLVLDVEPGQIRELTPEEVNVLRLTAAGKLKPKRPRSSAMLPKEAGRPAEEWQEPRRQRGREGRPQRGFGGREGRPFRPRAEATGQDRPRQSRPGQDRPRPDRPGTDRRSAPGGFEARRPARDGFEDRGFGNRPPRGQSAGFDRSRPAGDGGSRPGFGGARRGGPPRGEEVGFGGERRSREFRGSDRGSDRGASRGPGRGDRERGFGGRGRSERPQFEGRPRFERDAREGRPPRERLEVREERGGFRPERPRGDREGFRREERPARREFRPREDGAARPERPARFGSEERRGGGRPGGRPPGGPRGAGGSRFGGNREGGGGRPGNRPGGGSRRGGPPRRGRG